jgi:hypothetical protein
MRSGFSAFLRRRFGFSELDGRSGFSFSCAMADLPYAVVKLPALM